jgi:hypothetical protein
MRVEESNEREEIKQEFAKLAGEFLSSITLHSQWEAETV